MSTKLALVLAIVCGFIAAIAMSSWMDEKERSLDEKVEPLRCVATKGRLQQGQILKETDIVPKLVAKNVVASNMIPWGDRRAHLGKVVKASFDPNSLLFTNLLGEQSKDFTPSGYVIREGMRAITLPVDQVAGVAGLIKPGDYVDVIGTFEYVARRRNTSRGATVSQSPVNEMVGDVRSFYVLQAAKVLALDSQVVPGEGVVSRRGNRTYRTVTLEVLPGDTMRLVNASRRGRLQLALRNPAENELVDGVEQVLEDGKAVRTRPTDYVDIKRDSKNLLPFDVDNGSSN